MMYLLFLLLTLFSGCQNEQNMSVSENNIREQLENDLGIFEISYDTNSYQFTDTVSVQLSTESKTGLIVPESLPKPGDHWGDFTVMKRFQDSGQNVQWLLSPDKTGKAVLKGLELSVISSDKISRVDFTDSEIEIVSSLMNDSTVPFDLIPAEKEQDFPLITILLIAVVLSLGLIIFFLLRKRRGRQKRTVDKNSQYYLEKLRELEKNEQFKNGNRRDQYKELYRFLSLFLQGISSSLRTGQEPFSLMKELEKPSGLNQWALRSLYPILGEIEDIFYNPAHDLPDEEILKGHLKTIIECCEFLQKEEEAAHV